MKWQKKGLICSHKTLDLPWYKKNTMIPVPYLLNDNTLRIFITFCDENNVGRIGFVDVNPQNPSEINNFSKEPVLDIGENGCFDDNGVIAASITEEADGTLHFYYSGYQLGVKMPYTIFSGLAISKDNGNNFVKYNRTPILDRINEEIASRCAPIVLKEDDIYKMWYTGDYGNGWTENNGKKLPYYFLKYLESKDGINWGIKEGLQCFDFKSNDEYGLAKPNIWKENNKYKMIYSIRTFSKGYRLGYAESNDGIKFIRMDDEIGIDVSKNGWDSEMICFGSRFQYKDKIYLFYCGNKYGLDGLGYAEQVS